MTPSLRDSVKSKVDPCFYRDSVHSLIAVIYVDDGLIACKDKTKAKSFINHLKEFVELRESNCETFLSMQLKFEDDKVIIHQADYIEKLLDRFKLKDINIVSTPEVCSATGYEGAEPLDSSFPY